MHLPSFITEMLRTAGHQAIAATSWQQPRRMQGAHITRPTTIRKTAREQSLFAACARTHDTKEWVQAADTRAPL